MSRTFIYQGWKYDFDESRPAKVRYVAIKAGLILRAGTDRGIRTLIENFNEEQSEKAGAV